jgi:hypothetical protein
MCVRARARVHACVCVNVRERVLVLVCVCVRARVHVYACVRACCLIGRANLGSAIARGSRVGAVQCRGADGTGDGLGEAEVGKLQAGMVRGEEQVCWLDVAVDYNRVPIVEEVQRREEVMGPCVYNACAESESDRLLC